MRLVEELLVQADQKIKELINSHTQLFIKVVKRNSGIKGIRWDDLSFRFEYYSSELPLLRDQVVKSALNESDKNFLQDYLSENHNTLDSKALDEVFQDLLLAERDWNKQDFTRIISKSLNSAHERIKHR